MTDKIFPDMEFKTFFIDEPASDHMRIAMSLETRVRMLHEGKWYLCFCMRRFDHYINRRFENTTAIEQEKLMTVQFSFMEQFNRYVYRMIHLGIVIPGYKDFVLDENQQSESERMNNPIRTHQMATAGLHMGNPLKVLHMDYIHEDLEIIDNIHQEKKKKPEKRGVFKNRYTKK